MVELADQQDIVSTYCKMEELSPEDSRQILNYAAMSIKDCNVDILSNSTCENLLPEDYQNDLIEETVYKAMAEKMRVFRDVDTHIQISLAYQFKVLEKYCLVEWKTNWIYIYMLVILHFIILIICYFIPDRVLYERRVGCEKWCHSQRIRIHTPRIYVCNSSGS